MNYPILPREDRYWKKEDGTERDEDDIKSCAWVVIVSIVLSIVIICIAKFGGR